MRVGPLVLPEGSRLATLATPVVIVLILAMMILPLPAFLLDVLFTFNIALAVVVLFSAIHTVHPLEFAAFPAVLLLTTLLRLALNVASTRIVLLNGHTGTDAAGKVIESFGHFVVGSNLAVGLTVFAILVVINFVVITKGAGRIAEVAARFTLDALPGRQMAIDADLNAGLIGEAEAKRRRREIAEESDFYGSMDGASKFVRGDAVAAILILFINIVGGLVIGLAQHGLSLQQAADNYILLSVGDGLVAQVPALVISMAAGLIVSRVGKRQDLGGQIISQLTATPIVLGMAAGILGLLGLVPGMPSLTFLLIAAALGGGAWALSRGGRPAPPAPDPTAVADPPADASWDDLVPVERLGLEVGFRLIPLVDKAQGGELLAKTAAVRRRFAREMGFLPPSLHIRDNLELGANQYRILLKGSPMGEGEAIVGMALAIDPGSARAGIPGTPTRDPAFGLPALWIEPGQSEAAQAAGYTVVDPVTVVATHLNTLMHQHAADLLGRSETQALIEHFAKIAPRLLEDLVPGLLPLAGFQRVLRSLLAEGLHIRDLRTIVETLIDQAGHSQDAGALAAAVRVALGPTIVQQVFGPSPELPVLVLEPGLERALNAAAASGGSGSEAFEPGLAETLLREAAQAAARQEEAGEPAALLVPDRLRHPLARLVRRALPRLHVLAHSEIPDGRSVRVQSVLGAAG